VTSRTAPDVAEVYELYEDEKWTTKEIADHFDVSVNEITAVRRSDEYEEFGRPSEGLLPSLAGQTGKYLDKRRKEACKDTDGPHHTRSLLRPRPSCLFRRLYAVSDPPFCMNYLEEAAPEVAEAVRGEIDREENGLEMIASENFASRAVMEAQGTVMTNKYAEGYPGKRYYGGCEHMDTVEELARERAREIFGADHANVQPHSGTQANMAVYLSFLEPGDTIMSLELSNGGHLSHGHPANFSGKIYDVENYYVDEETGRIDYDDVAERARDVDPDIIVSGYSAYPREIDFERFGEIADDVGAYHLADIAHIAGLVATGEHVSPVPHADFVTTTTHKTLRGPRGGMILCDEEYASDIDSSVFPGVQGGPLMHVVAAKAVCFGEAGTDDFSEYQEQIVENTRTLARTLKDDGWSLVSGGSDNHLVLVDLRSDGVTGKEAEEALEEVGITVNKNTVPGEERSPTVTSGARIGTPALTTRGMEEEQLERVGGLISRVLDDLSRDTYDEESKEEVTEEVDALCDDFPLYPELSS